MSSLLVRPILLAALLATVSVVPSLAQLVPPRQIPGGINIQQGGPERGRLLRQRLMSSGLPPEQIRSRLRSAGFPSNLLDQYLTVDTMVPTPGQAMLEAMNSLGLAEISREDSLLLYGDLRTLRLHRDSLRIDSIIREDSLTKLSARLELFGFRLFRSASTEFTPLLSAPVDDTYRLGPGDGLALVVTGETQAAHQLDVTREGLVVIPDVGQLYVNNLTLGQLRELLYDRLGRVYAGVSRRPDARTKFDVTVSRLRAVAVRVTGEVSRPGSYLISASGGVLSALYEAGGPTENANYRTVRVLRGNTTVGTVDLYDYLLSGMSPLDLRLTGGDVIFVPVRGPRVRIAGAVIRPAIYELKPGETVRDLVRLAGGLAPEASATSATIDRIIPIEQRSDPGRSRTVLTVDLRADLDSTRAATPLMAGDSVTIFSIRGARTLSATIEGSVWQPGTYRLDQGMRLNDLVNVAGGLRPETYAGRAQIIRTRPDSTRFLIGVALEADASGARANPALQEGDRISIYARTDFRPDRYVAVWGSVQKPGVVAYADSMTLRDAVLMAGGIMEDGYLSRAEIARQQMTGDRDSLAIVFSVPLDSSFVMDPTGRISRPVGTQQAPDVYLTPYDNVYIRRQPGWEEPRNVVITGEVQFPGRYTITSRNFRLSDLISRAGGLTDQAYPNGVRFFRRDRDARTRTPSPAVTEPVSVTMVGPRPMLAAAALAPRGDTTRATPSELSTRLGVDLARVVRERDHRDNLVLLGGDSIHIPAFQPIVMVEGAVNSPSAVTYVQGKGLDYYVDAAGGYARIADRKGTFFQQPNGVIQKKGRPEAGAVVVVPRRESPPEPGMNSVALIGALAQLVGALTTIIVVIAR